LQIEKLGHPVLQVYIGGTLVEKRPSSFRLITDKGFPSVVADLEYPVAAGIGNTGDKIVLNLCYGDDEYLLFTGEIYDAKDHGAYRNLALTDSYKKLCDTKVVAAYRKEMACVILQDTLDAAGIGETAITCPEVEIDRFSTQEISAEKIILHLIDALQKHGHEGLRFFFDEKDVFHFGKTGDTGKNEGEAFEFETGKSIFWKKGGCIEVVPLPIRHLQKVKVDGTELTAFRTVMFITGYKSRLLLWVEEAE